ncbi:Ig-like domain-containing protein [Paucilactobacillus hokkaidonensis]|nr:Ig-like domain-containing protein [Paucilactobacillus hokkaidonensis]
MSLHPTSVVDPSSAVFPTIVWMSANQNVVTVDADGNITAQEPGTTTITATLTDTFGNVKTYVHDFTVDLADSSALPSYTTADEVTQILTSTTIQQLLAANGLTYSDLAPFSGKQFTSTTIYYSFNDSLLDLTTSDGQTFTEDQLVAMASDQWNKALASVGSSIVFLPADDEHTANLVFGQKDDSEIPGYAGMTYTNYNLDTMIINDPVNIVLNIDAVNSHYSETAMINVLVHEMGHALGLGHINDNTNVMWYAAADNTLLTVQDSISVLLNYELPSGTTSEATIGVNDYTPTQLAVV